MVRIIDEDQEILEENVSSLALVGKEYTDVDTMMKELLAVIDKEIERGI